MSTALGGRVGVVTGAARGIGRAIALELARSGADLVLCGRQLPALSAVAAEVERLGRQALVFELDVTDPARVGELTGAVRERFGRADVLVNNAGTSGPSAALWEIELEQWRETLDVNLTGPFLCSRAVLPLMLDQRSGCVIFISSVTGKRPLLHRSPYATTKVALVGLCRTLALDVGPYGIRANVVSPGFVDGERMDWVFARQAEARGISAAEARAELEGIAALGRMVSADEVARAVAFLSSDDAAGITGVDLNVAAGSVMY
ncbi:MAG: SDR family NAD(P)-dependent oxidoreductase [Acidimicrobiales bacterium]